MPGKRSCRRSWYPLASKASVATMSISATAGIRASRSKSTNHSPSPRHRLIGHGHDEVRERWSPCLGEQTLAKSMLVQAAGCLDAPFEPGERLDQKPCLLQHPRCTMVDAGDRLQLADHQSLESRPSFAVDDAGRRKTRAFRQSRQVSSRTALGCRRLPRFEPPRSGAAHDLPPTASAVRPATAHACGGTSLGGSVGEGRSRRGPAGGAAYGAVAPPPRVTAPGPHTRRRSPSWRRSPRRCRAGTTEDPEL